MMVTLKELIYMIYGVELDDRWISEGYIMEYFINFGFSEVSAQKFMEIYNLKYGVALKVVESNIDKFIRKYKGIHLEMYHKNLCVDHYYFSKDTLMDKIQASAEFTKNCKVNIIYLMRYNRAFVRIDK